MYTNILHETNVTLPEIQTKTKHETPSSTLKKQSLTKNIANTPKIVRRQKYIKKASIKLLHIPWTALKQLKIQKQVLSQMKQLSHIIYKKIVAY